MIFCEIVVAHFDQSKIAKNCKFRIEVFLDELLRPLLYPKSFFSPIFKLFEYIFHLVIFEIFPEIVKNDRILDTNSAF